MAVKKTVKRPTAHHGATPTDPLAQRAQQATDLKYGPDLQALHQLGVDATSSYREGVGQARAAADSIVAGVNESSGGLADFLARAAQRSGGTLSAVQPGALTPKLANEAAIVQRNNGLDLQSVAAQLANTKVRAQEAANYQGQHLYSQYQDDLGKINSQASSLAGQAGQYAQQVYQSLLDDRTKNRLAAQKVAATVRNAALQRGTSRLIAGVDQNGQVIPGSPKAIALQNQTTTANASATRAAAAAAKAKRDAAAKKHGAWLPPSMQNTYIGAVKTIAGLVRDQVGKPVAQDITLPDGSVIKAGGILTSHAARQLLTTKNNPLGRAFDPTQINAAFDVAAGGLSKTNVDALHAARVKVHGFLPTGGPKKAKKATLKIGPAGFPQITPGG